MLASPIKTDSKRNAAAAGVIGHYRRIRCRGKKKKQLSFVESLEGRSERRERQIHGDVTLDICISKSTLSRLVFNGHSIIVAKSANHSALSLEC